MGRGPQDAYFTSTIASATARVERSSIGSRTRMTSSAPASARRRRCATRSLRATGGTSCGRSPAPSPTLTSTHALCAISPGSRPALTHAASTSPRRLAKPSTVLPYELNHVFQASTNGRAIPSMRAPFEPDSRRDHGERGKLRPRVPRPALRLSAPAVKMVIADPDGLEPRLLGSPRDRGDLRPANFALHLGQLDPHTHDGSTISMR